MPRSPPSPLLSQGQALARHLVEGVAQKVHIAALPGCLGQDFSDRRLQPLMIVENDELDRPARGLSVPRETHASSTGPIRSRETRNTKVPTRVISERL